MQDSKQHIPVILGRLFLVTSNAIINCRNGIIKLSFGNMTIELNVFNICKQPVLNEEVTDVDMIETLVVDSFGSNLCNDQLEKCLTHSSLSCDVGNDVQEVNYLLHAAPFMVTTNWKAKVEPLPLSDKKKKKNHSIY